MVSCLKTLIFLRETYKSNNEIEHINSICISTTSLAFLYVCVNLKNVRTFKLLINIPAALLMGLGHILYNYDVSTIPVNST